MYRVSSAHLSMSDSLNLTCYRWESAITGFWSFSIAAMELISICKGSLGCIASFSRKAVSGMVTSDWTWQGNLLNLRLDALLAARSGNRDMPGILNLEFLM